MGITIKETFQVQAPIDTVWKFVMDPTWWHRACRGQTEESSMRRPTSQHQDQGGRRHHQLQGPRPVHAVDEAAHVIEMTAEGRETGGGIAKGGMVCRLVAVRRANRGRRGGERRPHRRIMQVGRG